MIKLSDILYESTTVEDDELDEANYPAEFDQKVFDPLSLPQKAKYARKHLKYIAKGSSRIVLEIDQETVLKIAMNRAGVQQNSTEADISRFYPQITAKVFEVSPSYDWIEMEKAKPARSADFLAATGLPSGLFFEFLDKYISKILLGREPLFASESHKKLFDEFTKTDLAEKVLDVVENHDLLKGDIVRPTAWGVVTRDGSPHLVLIDYGITNADYDFYYRSKRNLNRQF
jgi:hypothetical protein